ncbi:hypothetical protein HPB47_026321 [Ixodes persulcatus]|uniref:Uncharacterized protein n=1 Tax=Ixodes persulcatus TaxID=34615 RepID=A0AC60PZ17_IXOPE|nr:hypothetical protein HPB47_026321 [Ixodes persulcatus]
MPLDTTLQKKGSKSVSILKGGNSKLRCTVMLCALADGTKLRPLLDAFRGHNTEEVKTRLADDKMDLVMISGGMTSVLQPMDVCLNKPFKAHVKRMYTEWIAEEQYDLTSTRRTRKADIAVLCKCIISAWKEIPAEMIRKSFRKGCISNRLDGMDDDALWDNEDSSTDSCSDCSDE